MLFRSPALVDRGDAVELTLLDTAEEADRQSRKAVVRLLTLQLTRQLKPWRESLLRGNAEQLQLAALGVQRKDWVEDIIEAAVFQTFVEGRELPRDRDDYAALTALPGLDAQLQRTTDLAQRILESAAAARRRLKKLTQLTWIETVSDVREQLDALLFKGFLRDLPYTRLEQYPRYLDAEIGRASCRERV